MNTKPMQEARINKVLDSQVFINGKVVTWRAFAEERISQGGYPQIDEVPDCAKRNRLQKKFDFQRKQWLPLGNEKHPETIAFYALKAELAGEINRPEYRLYKADGEQSVEVPKIVYDYAVGLK